MRKAKTHAKDDYEISLRRDEEGTYFATVDELPGCMADGATPNQAVDNLREATRTWISSRKAAGLDVPRPRERSEFSGKFLVRMRKSLHAWCARDAAKEGVSLNQFIVSLLSEACGKASASQEREMRAQTEVTYGMNQITTPLGFYGAPFSYGFPIPWQLGAQQPYVSGGSSGSLITGGVRVGSGVDQSKVIPITRDSSAA